MKTSTHSWSELYEHLFHKEERLSESKLAQSIVALSDAYNEELGKSSVWDSPGYPQAYLNYYFPLNLARQRAALTWAKELGFLNLETKVFEFGSGPGNFQFAAHLESWMPSAWSCAEASSTARRLHEKLFRFMDLPSPKFSTVSSADRESLFLSSYTLTETELPKEAFEFQSLFLVEASTRTNGRKLMSLRQTLVENGYHIWGPCTHQESCPLLINSKKDWCHFRIFWEPSKEYLELEKRLPMTNRSLTFSYLLASKKPPPENLKPKARIIGDSLFEKGKVRQALCRGPKREFLSWLKRKSEFTGYPSGKLIDLPESITIKGNELRLNE